MSGRNAQERWDAIYDQHRASGDPEPFVALSEFLPEPPATAVDLAGGTGGTALWLAANGYDTTLVDISPVALNVAEKEATEKKVSITTIYHDLESGEPLGSLWDIAVCCNFYDPDFFTQLHTCVVPGGIVFVRVATVTNLERHSKPSRKYLVESGELKDLLTGFEPLSYVEDWFDNRHEARIIGRREID
ncbi:MAG: methyltransferase domain-containing protein [Acidimicrobiales bacterium]|nr:methyltransferase domain-containing protein [Acidimicrobiales bacterium]